MLEGLTNYEKSRQNYPWLADDGADDGLYDPATCRRSRPLSLLAEIPDAASQYDQSITCTDFLEAPLPPEPLLDSQGRDPNIVSTQVFVPCISHLH